MDYIIGIDGGGTKTEAVAYTLEGKELSRALTGFSNVLIDKKEAIKNIITAIDECNLKIANSLENNKLVAIYLGMAGGESEEVSSFVTRTLTNKYGVKVKVVNDAVIAIAALLKGEDGILTISGTGSISYGVRQGKVKTAGGWGHLLGDEGSGYFIAIEALRLITLEEDMDKYPSNLSKALLKEMGIENRKDIINFVYGSPKGEIAALVPVVVSCAQQGESDAIEILKRGGRELAKTTLIVYESLGFKGHVAIGIKGSILTKISMVREEFENTLKESINQVTIINEEVSPTLGAYYLALKEL
ncbi:N-acetylmuramic acid/N-acetylglucosamine kinase [bioreactor metagenome]|uniref:N-acetylmuramic acid/N-acetylglucosamine kinase n=1 Tax=bioreactor metagenome TaxID=1076179 RepID=A0A645ASJ5_9ZZZZ